MPNPEGSILLSIAIILASLGSSLWIPTASNSLKLKCYMAGCSQLEPTWSRTPDVAFRSPSFCLHLWNNSSSNFWSPSSPIELARLLERGSVVKVKWFPKCLLIFSTVNFPSGSEIWWCHVEDGVFVPMLYLGCCSPWEHRPRLCPWFWWCTASRARLAWTSSNT